ncbi:MAG: hypothetical protein K6E29_06545 [Cyanobacteria bacterium RUI128]|nr:hypothetical protein [Cyanobacteria bacterium RUI128]
MNITLSPITNTYRPAFKGYTYIGGDDNDSRYESDYDDYKVDYDIYKEDLKRARSHGFQEGCIAGFGATAILGMLLVGADSKNNQKETDKFINRIDSVYKSNDIKEGEFMVKDMNGDEKPDFVLFKKDGSKVVIDINNRNIVNQKK